MHNATYIKTSMFVKPGQSNFSILQYIDLSETWQPYNLRVYIIEQPWPDPSRSLCLSFIVLIDF